MASMLAFEWDETKDSENQEKHKVSFTLAQEAFYDLNRIISIDEAHSKNEERLFCIGKVENKIITVRFTMRGSSIRIIGAGYWRKGKKIYEQENKKN